MDPDTSYFEHPTPRFPSHRTPHLETQDNLADQISSHLLQIRHRKWGFVVYRCTYEDDNLWDLVLSRLKQYLRDSLSKFNGLNLLEIMLWTVFDDQEKFDDASTATIRDHFNNWSIDALFREQGVRRYPELGDRFWETCSPRYNFCIQIDLENLEAILNDPFDEEWHWTGGFVNLIWAEWAPVLDLARRLDEEFPGRFPLRLDRHIPVMEAIEGCTEEDVGWMQVAARDVLVSGYEGMDRGRWGRESRRPPNVVRL